jgi:hypothetical protein
VSAETNHPRLVALQREFMAALREPIYGGSRELTALPARAGAVSPAFTALADREIRSTPALDAHERLELYHRQYWYRLLDALDEDFPALRRILGETAFWRLIEAYLEHVPSRSYTLRHLGVGLPDFLQLNPGLAAGRPVAATELARLEYALCDSFEAPVRPPVPVAALATAELALQPYLRLFAFYTPADELWRGPAGPSAADDLLAMRDGGPAVHLAVFRHQARQHVQRLAPGSYAILQAIAETGSLAQALDSTAATTATATEVSAWFQSWTELGWLCEPETPVPSSTPAI